GGRGEPDDAVVVSCRRRLPAAQDGARGGACGPELGSHPLPSFKTVRHVSFTPREMFEVVADVERYPEFLPLCEGLTVHERKVSETGSTLTATMTVGYKAITERFKTHVTIDPEAGVIRVRHLDGPFTHLNNEWRFVAAG